MRPSDVTVVVAPRERFSFARESLESLYEHTPGIGHVVYIDGGSPLPVRSYLETQARARSFEYIRINRYLSPNEARNIGLRRVKTPLVAFVDNDVLYSPQWLDVLLACMNETGAAIVGPIYHINVGGRELVHMAGGESRVETDGPARVYVEKHRYAGMPLASAPLLERAQTDLVEFHAMLVRTNVFEETGPLDEGLLSAHEHVDLCLKARELGHRVFFDPNSVVTYVPAQRLHTSDMRYFMLRWSERWNRSTLAHFNAKWGLDTNHRENRSFIKFGRHHRCRGLRLIRSHAVTTRRAWAAERVVVLLERCVNIAYTTVAWGGSRAMP